MSKKTTTIKTISHEMGLSVSTISKALNGYADISENTRKHVLEVAAQMGYIPNMMARNLVKQVSNVVGLIIPDIETSIYGELFKSIQIASRLNGINLFLCDSNRDRSLEIEYVRTIIESQAMGLIIAPQSDHIEHIKDMVADRIPVVYVGGKVESKQENFVSSDNWSGTLIAMKYLFDLGHRDIVVLSDNKNSASCRQRIQGYERFMREQNLTVRTIIEQKPSRYGKESGYVQTLELIRNKKLPTAIFAVKDLVAVGVIQALAENGITVPHDISVMGYDDISLAALPMLNLTTIAQPKQEMGEHAMRILLERIGDYNVSDKSHYFAHPKLVERTSCVSPSHFFSKTF